MNIPFNKPPFTGKELEYINQAVQAGKLSGNGFLTKKCHSFFQERYGFMKCLLTTSATDALEMASLLANIEPGDEVIMPSYTFVSTANAFILRGATIKFVDSKRSHPNMDEDKIENLITNKTKAIVPVHYAGIAVNMDKIQSLANRYRLYIIEDAAQSIDSYYAGKPLGGIGHLAAFSFHETKNISCGEGGMLVINTEQFLDRADIIWEKGTNRKAFFEKKIDKYGWVDIGSSFLPSEITAAFLKAQLDIFDNIQEKRIRVWNIYYRELKSLEDKGLVTLPSIPEYATNNGHIFYLICKSLDIRDSLISYLKSKGIHAVFHYLCLHQSPFFKKMYNGLPLPYSEHYSNTLLRLPIFYDITEKEVLYIIQNIRNFFGIE